MGWFWGNNKDDPVNKLDPGLREYLEQETPSKYEPAPNLKQPTPPPTQTQTQTPTQTSEQSEQTEDKLPAASLYQDGRYAHLWKTYKPLAGAEEDAAAGGASRVIEKFKERGDTVQRAAMENCALEHEALTLCFQTGNWRKQIESRLTNCAAENGTFSRCFVTQSKFLQALGYASSFQQDAEKEERIQMHADKLYHQMLNYEKRVEEAKAAGQEPPPLMSLFDPKQAPKASGKRSDIDIPSGVAIPEGFKPSKPIHQLTPHERELEIRAHNAQLEQHKLYAEEAAPFMRSHEESRAKRKEKMTSWFGESIGKWLG
ncbi:hypothetical protein N7509_009337 [Penicillium cosmopolitanum]|uniref:Uncharacterized protein n=1 Tax=Penicillium cosmopolitanum TaxID=1131564 RepID=A0A9X0B3K2_9EURO|nr:uncharacterized protein N7509_009337 [Penicillium cosmopolitanum]KAJ5386796.1 hypothetical protein N7509_009337 [Penicillium cosmopolitanum]